MDSNSILNGIINHILQSKPIPGTQVIVQPNSDAVCNVLLHPNTHMLVRQFTKTHLGVQVMASILTPEFKEQLWSQIGLESSQEGFFMFMGSDGDATISLSLVELEVDK